jgi:hypothetical protein
MINDSNTPSKAWWREPMMWLVVGGPLVVVVAGLATVGIAVKHPDPVLPRDAMSAPVFGGVDGAKDLPADLARKHGSGTQYILEKN